MTEEIHDAQKQFAAKALGAGHRRAILLKAFLDVPDDFRADLVPMPFEQRASDGGEQRRSQRLERFESAGEVRMIVVYLGSKVLEFLHRLLADRRNLRVDLADTEVRSIADAFWRPRIPYGFRKWPVRRGQRKRVTGVLVRLGIEHQCDISDTTRHWPFNP